MTIVRSWCSVPSRTSTIVADRTRRSAGSARAAAAAVSPTSDARMAREYGAEGTLLFFSAPGCSIDRITKKSERPLWERLLVAEVRVLERHVEAALAHQRDRGLELVAALARDAHLPVLDRGLDLELRILDQPLDLLAELRVDALPQRHRLLRGLTGDDRLVD